ncbi:TraL conjugative transposon family protein, partial [Salmonella enterica]
MNRLKKWIRYVPDRIGDGLRYLCGRMSPDVRL